MKIDKASANQPLFHPVKGGFATGRIITLLVVVGVIGSGAFVIKHLLDREETKIIEEKYWSAQKSDFTVKVKLTGTLVSTDVITIKSNLEGETTIQQIVKEGDWVEGNSQYTIKAGDTIESIAEVKDKDVLSIKTLNVDEKIDWDDLPVGQSILIPGDLLIELDPLGLESRINAQEIRVDRAQNDLNKAIGHLKTLEISTAFALKVAQNSHRIATSELEKAHNSTVKNFVEDQLGIIRNLEKEVMLAEKNLKAYTELKKLGFVSDVEVIRQEVMRDKAQHSIKMKKAQIEAYNKFDKVSLLSLRQLAVDESLVNIKKTEVSNAVDLSDANSTVITVEKTLVKEKENLEKLNEQMASTKIYASERGQVVYYPGRYGEFGPIDEGAKVHRGRKLIKLPKTRDLKVELEVLQAQRKKLTKKMQAWVDVDGEAFSGKLTDLDSTVDTNKRRHSETKVFNGEITFDSGELPESASEGMDVRVEIVVVQYTKKNKNQLIKVPNQCVTRRMVKDKESGEDIPETGCWVLDTDTKKHKWRPVTIENSDEKFIVIKSEKDPNRGLREGELVHLSPLSEHDSLNLEESVIRKGGVERVKPESKSKGYETNQSSGSR